MLMQYYVFTIFKTNQTINCKNYSPLDIRHIMSVQMMFRKRPSHLLNIPVSTRMKLLNNVKICLVQRNLYFIWFLSIN